jgi:hypothetical protein
LELATITSYVLDFYAKGWFGIPVNDRLLSELAPHKHIYEERYPFKVPVIQ